MDMQAAYGAAQQGYAASDSGGSSQAGYGSGLVGGILDAFIGPVMANVQKGWASRAARKQRQWAEMMSSTAYQRAVRDLRAAGLNPALAYVQGGASTPSGAAAHTPDIDMPSFSDVSQRAMTNARTANLMKEELELLRSQRRKATYDSVTAANLAMASRYAPEQSQASVAETWNRSASLLADTPLKNAQRLAADAGSALAREHGKTEVLHRAQMGMKMPGLQTQAEFEGSEFYQGLYKVERTLDALSSGLIGGALGAAARGSRRPKTRRTTHHQRGHDAYGRPTGGYSYERTESDE